MIVGMSANSYLTSAEVAQRWRVTTETVRRWMRDNAIPHLQIGRRKLIPASVLHELEQVEQPRQDSPLQPTTNTKEISNEQ
jgi:excisionase family DNA binding protein